jgi:hypothetical protein
MDKNKMKDTLGSVCKLFEGNPDMVLASWSAIYNDSLHHHIRADLLFLNILQEENGELIYRRVRPAIIQKGQTGGPELYYNIHELVRIKDGKRRGQVLPIDYLHDEETYVPSGLCKKLRYNIAPNSFHANRVGDRACVELLENLVINTSKAGGLHTLDNDVRGPEEIVPVLHLISKMSREVLNSRRTGATVAWLRGQQIDSDVDLDATASRVAASHVVDAGPGMVAYPFQHYHGRGVIGASLMSPGMDIGKWYSMSSLKGSSPGIVFDCEL